MIPDYGNHHDSVDTDDIDPETGKVTPLRAVQKHHDPRRRFLADMLLSRDDLDQIQPPEPLIDGVLDLNSVGVLVGDRSTLKTFLALDWAASVATGRPWQGRKPSKTLRCLYMAGEGGGGIRWRLESWEAGWQQPRLGNEMVTLPTCPRLHNHDEVDQVAEMVHDGEFGLVVVDTLSKAMPGEDENAAQAMSQTVASLYRIQEATDGGIVLGLHHTGKDGMTTRGSSVLEDGVDTVIRTRGSAERIELETTKRKEAPEAKIGDFRLRAIKGTNSGVIENVSDQGDRPRDGHLALLDTFREHFSETGASSAQLRDVYGASKATFHRHLNKVVEGGFLVNQRTDQQPFYVLA